MSEDEYENFVALKRELLIKRSGLQEAIDKIDTQLEELAIEELRNDNLRLKSNAYTLDKKFPNFKRPASGFQIFFMENASHGKKFSELSREDRDEYNRRSDEQVLQWLRSIIDTGYKLTDREKLRYKRFLDDLYGPGTIEALYFDKPRPTPPFYNYVTANRPTVVAENKNATYKEITQILGKQWKSMSDQEKAIWRY